VLESPFSVYIVLKNESINLSWGILSYNSFKRYIFIPEYLKFSFGIEAIGLIILSGVLFKKFMINKKNSKVDEK
jgi:hypothetical protein